jgi:PTS system mannitol-specific IIC component
VQKFGTFLSNMVMPNIGAFIAWGLITALFIENGWLNLGGDGGLAPNGWVAEIGGWGDFAGGGIVGPMITYLLPILIGYTGGKMLYDVRGGVVGAIATMGVIAGAEIPMFMGAMIMGPLGGWSMKKIDALWDGKIKPGFEMLVNNFSAGIWGGILATLGFFVVSPLVSAFADAAGAAVEWLVVAGLLPLTSIFIEPAKVLFLNNAINHGVLTPLGTTQSLEEGKSILFLLEANPGPGLGLLLAYMFFGKGVARASAPGAALIHFVGGIHEIYFPYVLAKPRLIAALILGGMTGVFTNVLFDSGLRAPAAPGSIIAVLLQTPGGSFLGVILSVVLAATVTLVVAAFLLKLDRSEDEGDLSAATASMEAMKGKKSLASSALAGSGAAASQGPIRRIVFACDAGMGSSAMGASVLRRKIQDAGFDDVTVTNKAISDLQDDVDLVVTHQDLTTRAKHRTGSAVHVSVDNFMGSPRYDRSSSCSTGRTPPRPSVPAPAPPGPPAPQRRPPRRRAGPRACSPMAPSACRVTRAPWRTPSARPATSSSPPVPWTPPTWPPCTSGRGRCRPTWATVWPSPTARTRPRVPSAARRCPSSATTSPSTGRASRRRSSSASRARATTTCSCCRGSPTPSSTRTRSPGSRPRSPPPRSETSSRADLHRERGRRAGGGPAPPSFGIVRAATHRTTRRPPAHCAGGLRHR